jgi:hypothetical protein
MNNPGTSSLAGYGEALGKLRALGITPNPHMTVVPCGSMSGGGAVVIVDRVADLAEPSYCVHGYAECIACYEMTYLGDQTFEAAISGRIAPLCQPCAAKHLRGAQRAGRISDTPRGLDH